MRIVAVHLRVRGGLKKISRSELIFGEFLTLSVNIQKPCNRQKRERLTMITPAVFHEDTFYEYFKPQMHLSDEHEVWGGYGLETYGKDFEFISKYDPNYVWTVVDGDSCDKQWIVAGLHFVNRICYIVTTLPHSGSEIEIRVENRPRSLTPIGLVRQIRKLERLLSAG